MGVPAVGVPAVAGGPHLYKKAKLKTHLPVNTTVGYRRPVRRRRHLLSARRRRHLLSARRRHHLSFANPPALCLPLCCTLDRALAACPAAPTMGAFPRPSANPEVSTVSFKASFSVQRLTTRRSCPGSPRPGSDSGSDSPMYVCSTDIEYTSLMLAA